MAIGLTLSFSVLIVFALSLIFYGAVIGEAALDAIATAAEAHDALVVSDEVYREIWYDEPPPLTISAPPMRMLGSMPSAQPTPVERIAVG